MKIMIPKTISAQKRAPRILLVEDNPSDVMLIREAFESSGLGTQIDVAGDGEVAIEMLKKSGAHRSAATPDLILLDLNLPRKDGREVLNEIKTDPKLKHIPVIVFSSSLADSDIARSYQAHANGYIVKPLNFDAFSHIANAIETFWFKIVTLEEGGDLKATGTA